MIAQIIHNPARTDRMENIIQQAAEQGFQYELWPAIMDAENPARGCHLAHRAIVQHAKDQNWPAVWIMEDDIMFTASGACDRFLYTIPPSLYYDIYTAGSIGTHKFWHRGDYDYPKTISGTHCYIVEEDFYNSFLSMSADEHLDIAIGKTCYPEGKMPGRSPLLVLARPMYALQQPGYSNILCQQTDYNNDKYLWQYEIFKG